MPTVDINLNWDIWKCTLFKTFCSLLKDVLWVGLMEGQRVYFQVSLIANCISDDKFFEKGFIVFSTIMAFILISWRRKRYWNINLFILSFCHAFTVFIQEAGETIFRDFKEPSGYLESFWGRNGNSDIAIQTRT